MTFSDSGSKKIRCTKKNLVLLPEARIYCQTFFFCSLVSISSAFRTKKASHGKLAGTILKSHTTIFMFPFPSRYIRELFLKKPPESLEILATKVAQLISRGFGLEKKESLWTFFGGTSPFREKSRGSFPSHFFVRSQRQQKLEEEEEGEGRGAAVTEKEGFSFKVLTKAQQGKRES